MSVRELDESQKMLCRFNLCEIDSKSRGASTVDAGSALLVNNSNEEKIDFLSAKIEVFEVIKPTRGTSGSKVYRMRCLHHVEATDETVSENIIPMKILVPHYEVNFFNQRMF